MDAQETHGRDIGLLARRPGEPRRVPARAIVIIGAGFSGTAIALNLLRLPHARPLRVVLIERDMLARGTAFGCQHRSYLLNVPAGRMSASSAAPLEFLAFAKRTRPGATAEDFLPRALYGEYLEAVLLRAARAAPAHVQLERIRAQVIALERHRRTGGVRVLLDGGAIIEADSVVLASGNPPPRPLPGSEHVRGGRYVADPWRTRPAVRPGESVLIAGTGLTMAEVALAADTAAKGKATIHAISRHGLLPTVQSSVRGPEPELSSSALLWAAAVSLRKLVRAVRVLSETTQRRGGDWREAITALRSLTPALWQRMPMCERRRFLRHVRGYWDVHRHRLPLRTWSELTELRCSGRLKVSAGRILCLEPAGRQVRVRWRARGAPAAATLLVDRVINCTGPDYDAGRAREPLLRSLIAAGIAVPDPLGLGIRTDEVGALVDAGGGVASDIYYIGPMLRPKYWETTAVQELRVHAEWLAWHLANFGQAALTPPRPTLSPVGVIVGSDPHTSPPGPFL
jgi:uncharacterized NAD(P)/FAD-binding protein YdhS